LLMGLIRHRAASAAISLSCVSLRHKLARIHDFSYLYGL
jgi:hypothetical protein